MLVRPVFHSPSYFCQFMLYFVLLLRLCSRHTVPQLSLRARAGVHDQITLPSQPSPLLQWQTSSWSRSFLHVSAIYGQLPKSITRWTSVFLRDHFLPGSITLLPHDYIFPFFFFLWTDIPWHAFALWRTFPPSPCSWGHSRAPYSQIRITWIPATAWPWQTLLHASGDCQAVNNYKKSCTAGFSWHPHLSQSSSPSAHSHVFTFSQRNFPKLTRLLLSSSSFQILILFKIFLYEIFLGTNGTWLHIILPFLHACGSYWGGTL